MVENKANLDQNLKDRIELDIGEISDMMSKRTVVDSTFKSSGNKVIDFYHKVNNKFAESAKIKLRDKMVFYNLLATMVKAGISLVKSLQILTSQTQNPKLKRIIEQVKLKIEQGQSFSSALADYGDTFSEAEVGMIGSGEIAGNLNVILRQISTGMEKSYSVQQKVKGAMMYPIIIFTAVGLVVYAMLAFIMPKLKSLFGSTGKDLPILTEYMIKLGEFLKSYWYIVFGGLVLTFVLFNVWKKTPKGKYALDAFILKLPIFGEMNRKMAIARFTRSLGNLIKSGISIVKALEIAAYSIGNEIYKERIMSASEDVQRGIPLAENLSGSVSLFDPMVVYMISIGEQSAQLDTMCEKLADFFEEEVDEKTKGFSKALEPMIMIIVGGIVAVIVYAIMGPIMNLADIGSI